MVTTLVIFSCLVGILLTLSCVTIFLLNVRKKKYKALKTEMESMRSQLIPVPFTHELAKKNLKAMGLKVEEEEFNGWIVFEDEEPIKYLFRQNGVLSEMYCALSVNTSVYDVQVLKNLCENKFNFLSIGKIQYDSESNEVLFQMATINVTEEQFNYSFGHLFGMFRGLNDLLHKEYDDAMQIKSAVISQSADSKIVEAKRGPLN